MTHFENDYNTRYRSQAGRFADVTVLAGLGVAAFPWVGFGACLADFDHDADLDLFVANGHVHPQIERAGTGSSYAQPNQLYATGATGPSTCSGRRRVSAAGPGSAAGALAGTSTTTGTSTCSCTT